MREPVRDLPRVEHMLEAIDNALSYTEGVSKEQLLSDKILLHGKNRRFLIDRNVLG